MRLPHRRRNKVRYEGQFGPGDLVVAKYQQGLPLWPAKIRRVFKLSPDPVKYLVQFFGTQQETAFVAPPDIQAFDEVKSKLATSCQHKKNRRFVQAVKKSWRDNGIVKTTTPAQMIQESIQQLIEQDARGEQRIQQLLDWWPHEDEQQRERRRQMEEQHQQELQRKRQFLQDLQRMRQQLEIEFELRKLQLQ